MGTVNASASVLVVGSINLDRRWEVARLPLAGETVLSYGTARGLGGKGANQAVAVAAVGVSCAMVGMVGTDDAGTWLLTQLKAAGVHIGGIFRLVGDSGQAQVVVEQAGDNLIVVHPGTNGALDPATVERALAATQATVVVTQQEIPSDAVEATVRLATAAGRFVILNAAPARPVDLGLLAGKGLLVVNQGEARELAGEDEPRSAARALRALGAGAVVVTLGPRGALIDDGRGEARLVAAPAPARVVDTTGAGDVLTGVVAASLARGLSLDAAAAWGVRAASWSVGHVGVRAPTLADIPLG